MFDHIWKHCELIGTKPTTFQLIKTFILKNHVSSFSEITVISKMLREEFEKNCPMTTLFLVESHESDNTVKFVLKTSDGNYIESVLIHHDDGRNTVCVSSQVFCALGCKFCATGANQYKRSLTLDEIVEQVLFASRYLKNQGCRVSNVVFMGMGEPFLNYDAVIGAIEIFNDPEYFNIGARHITISTSGIVPRIIDFASYDLQVRLAISLHAPNDELRSSLMPINKRYPISELMKACDFFTAKRNKKITYEYVLIDNVNDSISCAEQLVKLLKFRLAHVNLLVFNPHEFSSFQRPSEERVNAFKQVIADAGIEVSVRRSMGDDISGACGQLSGKVIRAREDEVEQAVSKA